MTTFKDNLATFPTIDHLARLDLIDASGQVVSSVENKAGSQGSLRLYLYLAQTYGKINPAAAEEGCKLYAEHTEDALQHPGKHPNIDRLLDLIKHQQTLIIKSIEI